MLARNYPSTVIGLDGVVVEVEVDYTAGVPDAAFQKSRERVQGGCSLATCQ